MPNGLLTYITQVNCQNDEANVKFATSTKRFLTITSIAALADTNYGHFAYCRVRLLFVHFGRHVHSYRLIVVVDTDEGSGKALEPEMRRPI